jgi:ankyrin repeat protein
MAEVAATGNVVSGLLPLWARVNTCCEVCRFTCNRSSTGGDVNFHRPGKVSITSERHFGGSKPILFTRSEQAADMQLSLFQAARAGDAIKFGKCVLDDAEINQTTARGQTVLMLAAGASGTGALEIIQLLLNADASVGARDNLGWSALHYACCNNNPEAAQALITKGATLNAVTTMGETSLMLAAIDGHQTVVDLLVRSDADVSRRDLEGRTALYHVAGCGQTAVAKQLLQSGASINSRSLHDSTPLMTAVECGNTQMANLLIRKKADLEAVDARGESAVFHCIRANNLEYLQQLIEMRAPLHQVNTSGQTVLDAAAELHFAPIHDHLAKALGLSTKKGDK